MRICAGMFLKIRCTSRLILMNSRSKKEINMAAEQGLGQVHAPNLFNIALWKYSDSCT